jgi:hypothetical protein
MADFNPYSAAAGHSPDFNPRALYSLNDAPGQDNSPASATTTRGPVSPSPFSPLTQAPAEPTISVSQRRRVSKPRPSSLLVGPRSQPPTQNRKSSSGISSPSSDPNVFSTPASAFASPGAPSVYLSPSSNLSPQRLSSYGVAEYTYSLPPTAADDGGFLLGGADVKSPDSDSDAGPLPAKRPLVRPQQQRVPPAHRIAGRVFEPPHWKQLLLHTVICLAAWPAIFFLLPLVRGSLFWTRTYVGLGCSAVGLIVGWSLLTLGRKWLESAGEQRSVRLSD